MISIFTRDLGLVFASAQGIRFEKSKLRPFTQDYSFGRFSFVKGKEYWRLTSAQEEGVNKPQELTVRIASLLERLLHGEQSNPELFDCIYSCQLFIGENPRLNDESLQTLESLIVIRILNRLGYIGDAAELNDHIRSTELAVELLDNLKSSRAMINKHINKALRESHL